jgi:tetraacyldisaccharide 4'-kinase
MLEYLYNLSTDKYRGFVPGLIKALLFLLSLLYGLIVRLTAFFCRWQARDLGCKVISVGNITVGGTGKTVLVEYLARYLKARSHKVAILSRGYASRRPQATGYEAMGDEPYMLQAKLEGIVVIVDKNRLRGARKAREENQADTLLLDDGFQQWRLKKDLEIVVIDAANPFGNQQMLPRGILREPLSALRRADILVLSKINFNPEYERLRLWLSRLNPRALVVTTLHQPTAFYELGRQEEPLALGRLKAKSAVLFSAIGDPASFEGLIKGLGIKVLSCFCFADHHHYTSRDWEKISQALNKQRPEVLITTEKDAARINLPPAASNLPPIFVLSIELKVIQNEESFLKRLARLYSP